ncbi:MAG: glycosyl hydrolase family 39 [Terriglobales bacterium]
MKTAMQNRLILSLLFLWTFCLSGSVINAQANPNPDVIVLDAQAPTHSFPHFWEQMFGSGRAILSLRDSYRRDLKSVKGVTGFGYVRFHGIFDDEVGVDDKDGNGHAVYDFSYVDQIYDGLLADGVRPFVEISFMPNKLAARNILHSFWYRPNISPPKDWDAWDALISAFAQHLVDRYGINEVAQWYFEVWNEPNLDFWAGEPKQATYWELYDHTALAIKSVSPRLRIGGPATAQAAWVDAFIRHCVEKNIPVDFVATHVYANDPPAGVFGSHEYVPRDQMVCHAMKKVHEEITASSKPGLPLILSEFNASYMTEPDVTDSIYMGPWLADTVRQCDGLVDMMSYWTFSDVFEEQGVVKTPFYGGYGLIAAGGIPKPAFYAFQLLHKLGDQRIQLDSDFALLTRKEDGTLVLALWNYAPPEQAGSPRIVTVCLKHSRAHEASIFRVDHEHGDFHAAYKKMGSPRYPTEAQIRELRLAVELPAPETRQLKHGEMTLTLPAHGLAVIEIK